MLITMIHFLYPTCTLFSYTGNILFLHVECCCFLKGLQNVQQMWAPKPEPIAGVPPGLEYLTMVDQLLVKQQIELLEGMLIKLACCFLLLKQYHLIVIAKYMAIDFFVRK